MLQSDMLSMTVMFLKKSLSWISLLATMLKLPSTWICWYTPCWSRYRRYRTCCQPLFTPWLTKKCMFVCVCATHDVRTLYTRSHVNTLAAVKLLLVLVVLFSDAGCWCQHHWYDAKASLLQRTWRRCLQCRVVGRVDLDNPNKIVCDQLLYEKMLELDTFGFLWCSNSCCHALSAWWVCVYADVDLLHVESFLQEVRNCCLCPASVVDCCVKGFY